MPTLINTTHAKLTEEKKKSGADRMSFVDISCSVQIMFRVAAVLIH